MKPLILLIVALLFSVTCSGAVGSDEELVTSGDKNSRVESDHAVQQRGPFLLAATDELRTSRGRVVDGITLLESMIDRITPLESPRREDPFRELLDWHHQLLDLYDNELEFFDSEYRRLTDGSQLTASDWHYHTLRLMKRQKILLKELGEEIETFRTEERAIAAIILQRRQLQAHADDLMVRIRRIEEKIASGKKEPPRLPELRHELSVVQDELSMLPAMDEDVGAYYEVLTALAVTADGWLTMKMDRWQAFDGLADVIAVGAGRKPRSSLVEALEGMIRTDRGLIDRLQRKAGQGEDKRNLSAAAWTNSRSDRNQELEALHSRLRAFSIQEMDRLNAAVGGFEADLLKVKPQQ